MENTQLMKTDEGKEKRADTSDVLTKSKLVAVSEQKELQNLSSNIAATTLNALPRIWQSAELEVLRRKAGLVAGALSDFQAAGGLVAVNEIEYLPGIFAVKLLIMASGSSIKCKKTTDGLDFDVTATSLVAENDEQS
jgi:hypothetical protein